MAKTYSLQRDIPMDGPYDLVVAGGGPAGSAAAICAARLGARVLLVEATGCLGGMGTSGLVCAFDPMSDGVRMLVGGFMRELVETMHQRGYLGPQITPDVYRQGYHRWTQFHPEKLKLMLDEFATLAGVEVRFFTKVIDAEADAFARTVRGVVLHNVEDYRYVEAKTFIDATGDAVLTDLCGAPCREAGRDTKQIMPGTLTQLFANVDWARFPGWTAEHAALLKAVDTGHFTQPDKMMPGLTQVGQTLGYLNGGHLFNLNALQCRSLSDGMMLGRRIAVEYLEFFRKYVAGCETVEQAATASLVGVRESRRIVGEYELTFKDFVARRQFPDQIAVYNKSVDIHPYGCSETELKRFYDQYGGGGRLKEGECHGIPYGILVPVGWRNLWVAGRCNSSDIEVHGAIRVMPAAAMMGQAAGTAAVQALKTGQPACELDTQTLVDTLRQNGAYLPQEELCRSMTRQ